MPVVDRPALCLLAIPLERLVEQLRHVDLFGQHREAVRVELREVEDVADQPLQPLRSRPPPSRATSAGLRILRLTPSSSAATCPRIAVSGVRSSARPTSGSCAPSPPPRRAGRHLAEPLAQVPQLAGRVVGTLTRSRHRDRVGSVGELQGSVGRYGGRGSRRGARQRAGRGRRRPPRSGSPESPRLRIQVRRRPADEGRCGGIRALGYGVRVNRSAGPGAERDGRPARRRHGAARPVPVVGGRCAVVGPDPLGAPGATEDDIANGVAFLLSEDAAFINGVTLSIDGAMGMVRGGTR